MKVLALCLLEMFSFKPDYIYKPACTEINFQR